MTGSNRFFVITGGPSAGKTALIEALARAGYACVTESGRAVIQAQMASGGRALPWDDPAAYADAMLERDVAAYAAARAASGPVFFDRGVVDVMAYRRLTELPFSPAADGACRLRRYNPQVFIAPPWPEIYVNDDERRQTPAEAERTYRMLAEVYTAYGYELVELPQASLVERLTFVLSHAR